MARKDYLSVLDLDCQELVQLLEKSLRIKRGTEYPRVLEHRHLALIFEKPSLRTRVTFEVAIRRLGGDLTYLAPGDIRLGVREPVEDVGRNLERWVDGIVARVFQHETLETLARVTRIPVINALSDREHPCQALADYMTIYEYAHTWKVHLAFIGDGNNVATSLMLMTALLGGTFVIASPKGYEPPRKYVEKAREIAQKTGAEIRITHDPREAVKGAHFIYTDVWASMGQEEEAEERRRIFQPFQVNQVLLSYAPEDARVMHCLPAHRGEEITADVLDSPRSVVLDQAENRLYTEMAILLHLFSRSRT